MSASANDEANAGNDATSREREMAAIRGLASAYTRLRQEIGKIIIGQNDVVDQLLIAMFCRSHCLLMGVPGLRVLLQQVWRYKLQLLDGLRKKN